VSVKEENEVILDRQTEVICIIEYFQKGKYYRKINIYKKFYDEAALDQIRRVIDIMRISKKDNTIGRVL
jgi:hypothetical protein